MNKCIFIRTLIVGPPFPVQTELILKKLKHVSNGDFFVQAISTELRCDDFNTVEAFSERCEFACGFVVSDDLFEYNPEVSAPFFTRGCYEGSVV